MTHYEPRDNPQFAPGSISYCIRSTNSDNPPPSHGHPFRAESTLDRICRVGHTFFMRFMKILMWIAISLLGATAVAVAGLSRGEPINSLWLVVAGVCTFAVAYRFYASWLIAKVLTVDDMRAPAAVTRSDGKDFVPTPKWVVFGHHFAAIAGPGPLVGPVLAAQFGYLPGTLWILIGAALGGGVHDAIVLFASMRRDGKSLGQMLKEEINPVVGMIAMFSLLAIIPSLE